MAKIIDLSKPITYTKGDPWFMRVRMKHKAHSKARGLIRFLGLPARLFPQGFNGWADDSITKMGVHSTTHLDAPWHYGPLTAGKKSKTIDEVPLEWCYADGAVIDMSHKADFDPITVADLEGALRTTGTTLRPGMIVLIRTDRDRFMGTKEFFERGTGMSREATAWLIDQGIRITGIDQWGWDIPLKAQIKKARETNDRTLFWSGHLVGVEKEYWHMEQLTNLKSLPPHGFKVSVFPLKLVGASAAPARVVAIIEDGAHQA
jgi:kynurenine formamidase